MSKRDDMLGVSGASTVIGSGVILKGRLTSEDDLLIDGRLQGEITTSGDITVGINGDIEGPLRAFNVTIAGSVKGNINADGEVVIRESGQLHGNVTAAGLSINPGGIFMGTNSIKETMTERDANGKLK
jgi:cytoskeletal protein CcmA (bactofilin family)